MGEGRFVLIGLWVFDLPAKAGAKKAHLSTWRESASFSENFVISADKGPHAKAGHPNIASPRSDAGMVKTFCCLAER